MHGCAAATPVMCRAVRWQYSVISRPWRLLPEPWDAWCAQGSAVIRELEKRTSIKSCNTDEGGCGRRGPMQQFLEGQQPRAFALQLVWESLQEAGQDIRDTLELIQEVLPSAPSNSDLLLNDALFPYFKSAPCSNGWKNSQSPFAWLHAKPVASSRIAKVQLQRH